MRVHTREERCNKRGENVKKRLFSKEKSKREKKIKKNKKNRKMSRKTA